MSCNLRSCRLLLFLAFVVLASNAFPQTGYTPGMIHGPQDLGESENEVGVRFQPYEKTPLTFTSKPAYVLVPVVVTDKEGKPVSGLKREDFQVQENGKDQKVASLEEIKPSAAPLSRPAAPSNEITNQTSADATPRRLVIIALDLVNTPFLDQTRSRKALIDHLSESIDPDCLYQMVTIGNNGVQILHDYTQETGPLVVALKEVASRFPAHQSVDAEALRHVSTDAGVTTVPATTFDPGPAGARPDSKALIDFVAANAEQAYAQRKAADAIDSTLQAFLQIAQRASGLPGRKSLIWITGSFPFSIDPGTASVNEGLSFAAYQHTMQLLEQQLISVYPVDARGLVSTQPDASVHLNRRNDVFASQQSRDASNRLLDTLNTMRAFADMTGGGEPTSTPMTPGVRSTRPLRMDPTTTCLATPLTKATAARDGERSVSRSAITMYAPAMVIF